ncbi:MAG: hypothetical protein IT563_19225 [Alphaproteobacteria bacterium]|nr:hypothetical protein [Alphaproteobacteria bacterium]
MEKKHPHADAVYKIIELKDQTYGVEVTIPDSYPTTISSFATKAEAEQWIAMHKEKAGEGTRLPRRRFGSFTKR